MAKDYFQDITPPPGDFGAARSASPPRPQVRQPGPPSTGPAADENTAVPVHVEEPASPGARGIRNISSPRQSRISVRPGLIGADMRETPSISGGFQPRPPRYSSRWWIWVAAALSVLVLGGLVLFAFRSTTVTVTPKSHTITLTDASRFTAYPAASAAGLLSYTVQVSDFEDSEVVPTQGTTHVENKASGSITVFNEYSAAGVRLIKDTRFATPGGLIFRVLADVVVPGKKGATPGQISVTVVADQAGEKYNVGSVARLTLPGLKSSPDMYAHVYAKSSATFTGGFVGDQPGVAPGALEAAIASVRSRLEAKAHDAAKVPRDAGTVVFPDLIVVTYQSQPATTEAGKGLRIHEKAHIMIPVFPADAFANQVAKSVSADAEGTPVELIAGSGFAVHAHIASTSLSALGTDPLDITLSGTAELVWKVDIAALAAALASRDQGAFQTIVNGFPGIEEAHARIEPFWKSTFPANASDIKIDVTAPKASAQ